MQVLLGRWLMKLCFAETIKHHDVYAYSFGAYPLASLVYVIQNMQEILKIFISGINKLKNVLISPENFAHYTALV